MTDLSIDRLAFSPFNQRAIVSLWVWLFLLACVFHCDRMLLVLLKDKKNRATEFPKEFSETELTWMYEYERVK